MCAGPDPVRAMADLHRLQLFPAVFSLPQGMPPPNDYGGSCIAVMQAMRELMEAWKPEVHHGQGEDMLCKTAWMSEHSVQEGDWSAAERRLGLLAALLLPFRAATIAEKKASRPVTSHLVRDSIKWPGKDAEGVVALHREAPTLLQAHRELQVRCLCRINVLLHANCKTRWTVRQRRHWCHGL